MNKLAIPGILAATVLIAGIFAFMPVEKASTVHLGLGDKMDDLQTDVSDIKTNVDLIKTNAKYFRAEVLTDEDPGVADTYMLTCDKDLQ